MAKPISELQAGDVLPPLRLTVTQEWVDQNAKFKDDDSPWYSGPSPFGGPIAPVTLNNNDWGRFLRANDFSMAGIIPTKTIHDYYAPMMVGSDIISTCKILASEERKGRHYVTFEIVTTDVDGNPLLKKVDTLLQMPQALKEAQ